MTNGIGLEVLGGDNYTVKNNIFANNGGGYASFISDSLRGDFDYNNYYSTKQKLARFNDVDYSDFNNFKTITGQEANGFAKNPFYSSDSVLQMNQVLLNDVAETGTGITTDIDATTRGSSPDFGAMEYNPCSQDAGVNEFVGLVNPLSIGSQDVKVELQNQGTEVLTSAVIHWEVNGVAQTPYNWSGSLDYKANAEVTIGTFSFAGGESYKLKAWTENPNGGADCNIYNDTAKAFDMATPMCGIYTIGGIDPDFTNFTDAAIALNNAGITCPVVFEIRDGIYDEQIKLYEISGASATNTITFRGESGDSSLVELHYTTSNPSNDFTLALTGTDYISFEDMSVLRTNGTNSVLIQNESHDVRFEHCRLGTTVSPNTSVDGYLTFRGNNMEGFNLNLQHPDNTSAGEVIVENNYVQSILINNCGPLLVRGNRLSDINSNAGDFTINRCKDVEISKNRIRRLILNSDTIVSVHDNDIRWSSNTNHITGIYVLNSMGIDIYSNQVYQYSSSYYTRVRGIELSNTSLCLISENEISVSSRRDHNNIGIYTGGGDYKNIRIGNNVIENNSDLAEKIGIYTNAGDSISIYNNLLNGLNLNSRGQGIMCINPANFARVDSNRISNYQTMGLFAIVSNSDTRIRYNHIEHIKDLGIRLEGSNSMLTNNTITGVSAGNGINITASNARVSENRFLNIQAGTGIIVNGADNLIANNFVEAEGVGIAKGISLQENGSGSEIVFNSVNITGTDVTNGIGLEVLGGDNYTVKNNIFANNGGGLATKLDISIAGSDWDYNDFYSSGDAFGSYLGTLYSDLGSWGAAINADANSNLLNPFYRSETDLRPSQRSINGAGIAASGITLDIDGELRNQAAPDVGADEYLVDFGITQLVSPTLSCGLGTSDSVTILIRQFGDVPFIDLQVAYQINDGPVNTGTVPGEIANDITYTFPTREDLAGHGTYNFKIWLIGSHDDNINNDTLEISRYSSDVPVVDFTFVSDCAGTDIPFTGSATVASGTITNYEWLFEDGDTATVQNPLHNFASSGLYNVTLRAYTDIGCYGDTTKEVELLSTPEVGFTAENACFGEEVVFENNSTVESGTLTYDWNFGDGNSSAMTSPTHPYAVAGKYEVELRATASSGCTAIATDSVEMFSQLHANLTTNIDTAEVDVTGGQAPYTIQWENGESGEMITDLEAGWHTVTITDANICSIVDSVEVVIPELQISVSGTDASCATCADGSASVAIVQGVAPFYFQWSSGSITDSASGLIPGMYYVTVRDKYLNVKEDSVYIDGVNTLAISLTSTDLSCHQSNDGAIDLTITGGLAPYDIQWTNGAITEDIDNLPADTYTVTVTDANGTVAIAGTTINEPDIISLSLIPEDVSCNGFSDGSISTAISGGTAPYSFLWDNGDTTQNLSGVSGAIYTLAVTDANGCTQFDNAEIKDPDPLALDITLNDPACNNEANGSAEAIVSGGTAPYSYNWSNGVSETVNSNLAAGTYTLTVKDFNECEITGSAELVNPEELQINVVTMEPACESVCNGAVAVEVNGGTAPYSYSWSNGATESNLIDLCAGIYEVTVTDANGCIASWSGEVRSQSKAKLTGFARYSKGFVKENEANVVLYDAASPHNNAVAEMRIGPDGSFSFTNIPEGQYILHVKLDNHDKKSYFGVMSSYYGRAWNWKGAQPINLTCEDSINIIVDMFENPAARKGNGKAGGEVNHEETTKKIAPPPVVNATVMLIDGLSGLPLNNIVTDENGKYLFSEVIIGEYSLYVDIPGISQKSTHHFSITESELEKMNLDFVVDAVWDMDINSIVNTTHPGINTILSSINLFPNPTVNDYVVLQSDLIDRKELKVVMLSDVGSVLLQRDLYVLGDRIKLDLHGFAPGSYILRFRIENEVQYRKIVIMKN